MEKLRKYGDAPFCVAILHGGPGIPGEVAPVAKELSKTQGILEPIQTKFTIEDQVLEVKEVLEKNSTPPIILIGYSWGAWLAFIFTAKHPALIKKLILLNSGPFEASYAENILNTRLSRLNTKDRLDIENLFKILADPQAKDKNTVWAKIGAYLPKTDSYDPTNNHEENLLEFQYDIYESIWPEALKLRKSGKLLEMAKDIKCPVVSIHGDYDPHPASGVEMPLSRIIKNFRFILIENCGHKPWIERKAKENFYKILKDEIKIE
jgi:pimeloyl-ACP methyl ester carboxylesterase